MVGVSSLYRQNPDRRSAFFGGLLLGELAGGVLVVGLLAPMSLALESELNYDQRLTVAAAVVIAFAVLDIGGWTPHTRRQTPQRLARQLSGPVPLGLVYGLDVGLVVTTQKASSLLYSSFLAACIVSSTAGLGVALTVAVVNALGSAFQAYTYGNLEWEGVGKLSVVRMLRGGKVAAGAAGLAASLSLLMS